MGIEESVERAKKTIANELPAFVPEDRPGDMAQALMELGALTCTPKNPNCASCPWQQRCYAKRYRRQSELPVPKIKRSRPEGYAVAFVMLTGGTGQGEGAIMLRRRPDQGLLAGMIDLPSTSFTRTQDFAPAELLASVPLPDQEWRLVTQPVRHIFTHLALNMQLMRTELADKIAPLEGCFWHPVSKLSALALPSLSKKILAAAKIAHPTG